MATTVPPISGPARHRTGILRGMILLTAAATAACCGKTAGEASAARQGEVTFDGAKVASTADIRAHGERLTWVLGCKGCHTPTLTGQNFLKPHPQDGVLYAPNLTQLAPRYTDLQLVGMLRDGTDPRRGPLRIMPSEVLQNLSDADMKALLGYLRSLPPAGAVSPAPQLTPAGKRRLAAEDPPTPQLVAEFRKTKPANLGPQFALGRYVASVTCAECHGADLNGATVGGVSAPNLIIAGAYTRAEFERLLTKGIATGNRVIKPRMARAAKIRFSHFTEHERDALYAYFKARAERAQ